MFSVVIPTHDRLDLLKDAAESVLRQNFADWELVVFDNASSEDIAGYVASLCDPRVRYARSDAFLPVTDSWNSAIDLARGDYITFLGDDDGLTPGYFTEIARVVREFKSPEVLYSAIFQFLHPGVAPWERGGYVADVKNAFFFADEHKPFRLSKDTIAEAVRGSLTLRRNFTFNIQAFVFSSAFLDRLRQDGPVFRSPFPDYYLANVALANAATVVAIPAPMSIAGVSKASFGYTLFNGLEEKGAAMLNSNLAQDPFYREVEKLILPGPLYNTNYLVTMKHVASYAESYATCPINFERYRKLQTYTLIAASRGRGWKETTAGRLLWSRLDAVEKTWASRVSALLRIASAFRVYDRIVHPFMEKRVALYGFHPVTRMCDKGSFTRLSQVFDALEAGKIGPHPTPAA